MGLLRNTVRTIGAVAAVMVLLLSLLGWHRYTSVGIDVGSGQDETAIRAKWFGDGTIHIGAGHGDSAHADNAGFDIDPAAAILSNVRERRFTWLRSLLAVEWLGYPGVRNGWERWLVLPVWIPAAIAAAALHRIFRWRPDKP